MTIVIPSNGLKVRVVDIFGAAPTVASDDEMADAGGHPRHERGATHAADAGQENARPAQLFVRFGRDEPAVSRRRLGIAERRHRAALNCASGLSASRHCTSGAIIAWMTMNSALEDQMRPAAAGHVARQERTGRPEPTTQIVE